MLYVVLYHQLLQVMQALITILLGFSLLENVHNILVIDLLLFGQQINHLDLSLIIDFTCLWLQKRL